MFAGTRMPEMVEAVLDGYHATVFAYGQVPHTVPMHAASRVLIHQHWPCMCMCMCMCVQTGSGKTFTMEGYDYEVVHMSRSGVMEQRAKPLGSFRVDSSKTKQVGVSLCKQSAVPPSHCSRDA